MRQLCHRALAQITLAKDVLHCVAQRMEDGLCPVLAKGFEGRLGRMGRGVSTIAGPTSGRRTTGTHRLGLHLCTSPSLRCAPRPQQRSVYLSFRQGVVRHPGACREFLRCVCGCVQDAPHVGKCFLVGSACTALSLSTSDRRVGSTWEFITACVLLWSKHRL